MGETRKPVSSQKPPRRSSPYGHVRILVYENGGTMTCHKRGPVAEWTIELGGRTFHFQASRTRLSEIDLLYVPCKEDPRTWDDYKKPFQLKPDALERLRKLVALKGVRVT
jgi:hypothetical protein